MSDQAPVVEALRDPGLYRHEPEAVEVVETHISWVFLAGDRAYKLKKAVHLPFLNYSTAARRRLMCDEELRLNRRLAPSLYLDVRSVVARGDQLALGARNDPAAVDYLVEMRRFRERDTLARRLDKGRSGASDLADLAQAVARLHADARVVRVPAAARDRVAASLAETLDTLAQRGTGVLSSDELAAARRFTDAFLAAEQPLLERRLQEGRIREGHGDLRLEHVVLGERLEVIDCIEFSVRLRELDVAAELAFPLMELEARGRRADAEGLLSAYRAAGGDPGPGRLIAFYAAERAWVRAKVALVRAGQLEARGREAELDRVRVLFALGRRLAWRARPRCAVVLCGPPASGKSTAASALSDVSEFPIVGSDRTRKSLAGVGATARAPAEAYGAASDALTYRRLADLAEAHLRAGRGVIVDATYRRSLDRRELRGRLGALGVPLLFVECAAPPEVRRERAARRAASPSVSDADAEVADRIAASFEPLDELPHAARAAVRTDLGLAAAVTGVEAAVDAAWAAGETGWNAVAPHRPPAPAADAAASARWTASMAGRGSLAGVPSPHELRSARSRHGPASRATGSEHVL